jgi:ATP-dependent RNA helicase DHX37/DHR1
VLGPDNSNATEIIPASKTEVEERRRKLREEIRAAQPESKFSSKKKKRLEHYIVCVINTVEIS